MASPHLHSYFYFPNLILTTVYLAVTDMLLRILLQVVGSITKTCPKHGSHYLLHSEASMGEYYTISLPTPVYTINQMLENINESTAPKTNFRQSSEFPLSLDTIYPNPSNTATILNKTVSWVPLPLINETGGTSINAGIIYIDPLDSGKPQQHSASGNQPV